VTVATDSDALTIARWCWPEDEGDDYYGPKATFCLGMEELLRGEKQDGLAMWAVRAAERIVMELGHAKTYGRELARHFGFKTPILMDDGGAEHSIRLAMAATAPLDVRVRAMAAVIRSLPT
jgi:hypothetical protein